MLSLETGLFLVPYILRRSGIVLGVFWLLMSYCLNKLSLWMNLRIFNHLVADSSSSKHTYVYNPLLVIHKSFSSSFLASLFFQTNYILYTLLQVKLYYYTIFTYPFTSMQIRQVSFY